MEFTVSCSCGRVQTVSEGSAGARIACDCGQTVDVPSLTQLRKQAGLSAIETPIEYQTAIQTDFCSAVRRAGLTIGPEKITRFFRAP